MIRVRLFDDGSVHLSNEGDLVYGPSLLCTPDEWLIFLAKVKAGEYDPDRATSP